MSSIFVFLLFLTILCTIITNGAVMQIPIITSPSGEMERPKNVFKTKIGGVQKSHQLTIPTNNTIETVKISKSSEAKNGVVQSIVPKVRKVSGKSTILEKRWKTMTLFDDEQKEIIRTLDIRGLPPLVIRRATRADLNAIVEFAEPAYLQNRPSGTEFSTKYIQSALLHAEHSPEEDIIMVIEERMPGRQLLACCRMHRLQNTARSTAHFGLFAVRETHQGHGLSKLLLAEVERYAQQKWACSEMQLEVAIDPPELREYYEKRGYTAAGNRTRVEAGDRRFVTIAQGERWFERMVKRI